jgi:hypothetical protein
MKRLGADALILISLFTYLKHYELAISNYDQSQYLGWEADD